MNILERLGQYSILEVLVRLLVRIRFLQKYKYSFYLIPYASYYYGIKIAVANAKELGEDKIMVIEFGVAGGNGLVAMQNYAEIFESKHNIEIIVVGVDTGKGLPRSSDVRDLPYLWQEGDYPMNELKLRAKLKPNTHLLIGNVKDKIHEISNISQKMNAKVAFISFDLDLFTSTKSALDILKRAHKTLLPRIPLYFDDVIGTIPQIGQLAAIGYFNSRPNLRAIGPLFNIQSTVPFRPLWASKFFELHLFTHVDYAKRRRKSQYKDLPLRG